MFVQVAGGIRTELCNLNYVGDLGTAELSYTIINLFLIITSSGKVSILFTIVFIYIYISLPFIGKQ